MILPPGIALALEDDPAPATVAAISDGLTAFNERAAGPAEARPVWVVARAEDGQVVGGLRGITFWRWLFVAWLWVEEGRRGQGIGAALLRAAEDEARRRDCLGAFVDTYGFQAPGFYARQGYREFGRLDDLPPGGVRIWLARRF
ncbi:GNAT family N-acetyltransferase [Elioraea sp. Yellowstone]|jgi:GNAT superfamily N-acetyltransferase|uniref:GNAT family N-acetyltransferase n=1 Tax=Elioraea sp. Yellowstone TaxID=2592070 RepID=UPI0011543AFD|nr:GNAT family N-acetyltransferase [Elioraea sp. Yellowstone]TQF79739.1 GNAT family N-acetyltransferase [Elioraea sp. Yellowstone]